MIFTPLLLAIGSVLARAEDSAATAPEDSAVVKLNANNFDDFVSSHPLVLAEFFAPWCGHCKHLGPQYAAAADILVKKDIPLAQVDCTKERSLCSKFGVRGFPTMKVFRGSNKDFSDYNGQRTSDSIVNYMVKQSLPAVSVLSKKSEVEELISDSKDVVIVQVAPKGVTAGNDTFYGIANSLRDFFTFVSTDNDEYVEKYAPKSGKKSGYVIFRPDETLEDGSVFEGKIIDKEALNKFIEVEAKPLFGEVDGSTFRSYMSADIPLAYYFYKEPEQRDEVKPLIQKLARKYRGKINFAGLDASKYGVHAENLNMKQKFPLFVIHDVHNDLKYGISQDADLDNAQIQPFVEKFTAGSLEPIVKSEPIPKTQEGAVYHLVGYEHENVTSQPKDVLVKYYAPWCGHCKRLAPIYRSLAEAYAKDDDAKSKVLLAEIDHTANDVPGVDIKGYPTLILYPADGSKPVQFDGQRTVQGMADFIKEHGTTNVDGAAIYKKQEEAKKAAEAKKADEAEDSEPENPVDEAEEAKPAAKKPVEKAAEPAGKATKPASEAPATGSALDDFTKQVGEKLQQAKEFVLEKKDQVVAKVQELLKSKEHDEL